MDIRNFVTFAADFPDDAQWDEQENLVVPGGRVICEFLRTKLQERGLSCSEVVQHSFYGWDFDAASDTSKVSCLLQAGDDWLLILEPIDLLNSGQLPSGFEKFQMEIQDILVSDERFTKMLWYTQSEYDAGQHERARSSPLG